MDELPFEEVLPNIVLVRCASVAIVLIQGEKLAVVDTGLAQYMPGAIEPALAVLGRTLTDIDYIIHTHGHFDHVQGTPSLVEASHAQIWIPAKDFDRLPLPADRLLADGDGMDLGDGARFQVIATPGHSSGIVCLYEPSRRLLIASDAAQGYGDGGLPLYMHSGTEYRLSLRKLMTLEADTMILGHPFKWSGAHTMMHRDSATIRDFLAESMKASRLVEEAVQVAMRECPQCTLHDLRDNAIQYLKVHPEYPFEPASDETVAWFTGTVCSELRDFGMQISSS